LENHYEVLGVDATASASEIRAAYLELAKQYHPDQNPSRIATRLMARINDAYGVLGKPNGRAAYDERLRGNRQARPETQPQGRDEQEKQPKKRPTAPPQAPTPPTAGSSKTEQSARGAAGPSRTGPDVIALVVVYVVVVARLVVVAMPSQPEPASVAPAPITSPTRVVQGVAPVAGPLDSAALSGVLQSHQPELQHCYENAVVASMREPGGSAAAALAKVRLDVVLAIVPSGQVDRAVVNGEAPAELKRCATEAITGWTFPASDRASDLSFPVVFERELEPP
jgi:hypothetical protein